MSDRTRSHSDPRPFPFDRLDHSAWFDKATVRAKRIAASVEKINHEAETFLVDVEHRATSTMDRWLEQVGLVRKARHDEEIKRAESKSNGDSKPAKSKRRTRVVRRNKKHKKTS